MFKKLVNWLFPRREAKIVSTEITLSENGKVYYHEKDGQILVGTAEDKKRKMAMFGVVTFK
jgi:hypothetical protein